MVSPSCFVLRESAAQAEDESDCPEAPPESDEASIFVVRGVEVSGMIC